MCEHCGKAFEAKTVTTRFCSNACNLASLRNRKKLALEEERKQQILQESKAAIAEIQGADSSSQCNCFEKPIYWCVKVK